jgi:hypothetical protein
MPSVLLIIAILLTVTIKNAVQPTVILLKVLIMGVMVPFVDKVMNLSCLNSSLTSLSQRFQV